MKLLFNFYSQESKDGKNDYTANIILDPVWTNNGKPSYFWFGDMDNDVDGTPYWNQDKYGQAETALRYQGKPVNGDIIPGIVVPPKIINCTPEIVLGCIGLVEYNDIRVPAVTFDVSPTRKIGEGSPALLRALGLPAPKNGNGGLDTQGALYRIWPGVAAKLEINGQVYQFDLQPS